VPLLDIGYEGAVSSRGGTPQAYASPARRNRKAQNIYASAAAVRRRRLTDAQGRTVDFKNAVVIMTSNLGADRIQQHARQKEPFDELKADLMQILQRSFRPEFINRIDDIIVFRALTAEQLHEITLLMLDRLARRLRAQRIEIAFTDEAVELLAHEGYDPEFGARPLKRTIQRLVENELSRMVLGGQVQAGDRVLVDALEGELRIDVESEAATEPTEEAAQPDAVQS
jgi:ATP-dependent Clp protease ATP-binding subunit ClpC